LNEKVFHLHHTTSQIRTGLAHTTTVENAVNIETERPALEIGDIAVMDNCSTHHFAGGEALQEWLSDCNIELVYTPTYSPDFNPAEFVFKAK